MDYRLITINLLRSDYLKLAAILGLAMYLVFIPHSSDPYPVHLDEWWRMAESNAMMEIEDVTATDPFYAPPKASNAPGLEAGFCMFWGLFHEISGLSWLTIIRYFPLLIFAIDVITAFLLGRRKGFGWQAALMVSLIPTSVGILGPGFLVPVAMGLPLVLLLLYIALTFRHLPGYVALFLLMCFLLLMHPPSAAALVLLIGPYILLSFKDEWKHGLATGLSLALPFLPVVLVADREKIERILRPMFDGEIKNTIAWPDLIEGYGYLVAILCVLGVLFLVKDGKRWGYGLVAGLTLLLAMLVTYSQFHMGLEIMYSRGLLYAMLGMGLIGGYGLAATGNLQLPEKLSSKIRPAFAGRNTGNILCFIFIAATLALSIPARQGADYYHKIDGDDYKAFMWIDENLGEQYDKAILDPFQAVAFTALTGRKVYSSMFETNDQRARNTHRFLSSGCADTEFLKNKNISIVYTWRKCNNPDLTKIREDIYVLK